MWVSLLGERQRENLFISKSCFIMKLLDTGREHRKPDSICSALLRSTDVEAPSAEISLLYQNSHIATNWEPATPSRLSITTAHHTLHKGQYHHQEPHIHLPRWDPHLPWGSPEHHLLCFRLQNCRAFLTDTANQSTCFVKAKEWGEPLHIFFSFPLT